MLSQIKNTIKQHFDLHETRWIFITCYDHKEHILASNGVISTDKALDKVIDMIYNNFIKIHQQSTKSIVCDIVTSINHINKEEDLKDFSPQHLWISISSIDYNKTGVILPQTPGIISLKDSLQAVKQKNGISWDVIIYSFETQKIKFTL